MLLVRIRRKQRSCMFHPWHLKAHHNLFNKTHGGKLDDAINHIKRLFTVTAIWSLKAVNVKPYSHLLF